MEQVDQSYSAQLSVALMLWLMGINALIQEHIIKHVKKKKSPMQHKKKFKKVVVYLKSRSSLF